MIRFRELWSKVINSRLLAGIGGLALLIVGGITISSLAFAQGTTYTTITTADVNSIQQQINSLHNRVTSLESRVGTLESQLRAHIGTPTQTYVPTQAAQTKTTYVPPKPISSPTYPVYSSATYPVIEPVTTVNDTVVSTGRVVIDQNGGRYLDGYGLFFTGRGFGPNEQLLIYRNGIVVGNAKTDGAGGFASSGVFLPLGTSSFVFSGQTSGVQAVATVWGTDDLTSP